MGFLKASTFSTDYSAMLAQKNNVDPSKQEIYSGNVKQVHCSLFFI